MGGGTTHREPHTLEEVLSAIKIDPSSVYFPKIFKLLNEEVQGTAEEILENQSIITLKEIPALVVFI